MPEHPRPSQRLSLCCATARALLDPHTLSQHTASNDAKQSPLDPKRHVPVRSATRKGAEQESSGHSHATRDKRHQDRPALAQAHTTATPPEAEPPTAPQQHSRRHLRTGHKWTPSCMKHLAFWSCSWAHQHPCGASQCWHGMAVGTLATRTACCAAQSKSVHAHESARTVARLPHTQPASQSSASRMQARIRAGLEAAA